MQRTCRTEDITAREKRLVAAAIMEGETAERSRLARDMHDGLGGMLSAIKLNLFDIKKQMKLSKRMMGLS